jgi:SAM-dependent methyltransferase
MSYWAERRTPTLSDDVLARIPDDVPRWKVAYWQFQHDLTKRFILPLLEEHTALPNTGRILEVGAGEGGCLAALHEATGLPADGLELSADRTRLAHHLNVALSGGALSLRVGDVAAPDGVEGVQPPYSLILYRDVIEHIEDRANALANTVELLAPGGHVLFTFPPYNSPFGAHQQILSPRRLRLPWVQLIPGFTSRVDRFESNAGKREEIHGLRRCRLTLGAFERDLAPTSLETVARRLYLLRPAFHYRYGLPVIGGGWLGAVPGLRELSMTGAWFLARRPIE